MNSTRFAWIASILLSVSSSAFAQTLPLNDLWKQDIPEVSYNVTRADFEVAIREVTRLYEPIVRLHGARLVVVPNWESSEVNAFASRHGANEESWAIEMFGGLARRPEISRDAFQLVVCHELGHHLAGFPFYEGGDWAASEGQSDYFATQECLKRVWERDYVQNARAARIIPPSARDLCDRAWRLGSERNLCYRVANAGLSLARLFARTSPEKRNNLGFYRRDANEVRFTDTSHPEPQCRLDTYLAGSLCSRGFDERRIPGLRHPNGQESIDAEWEMANHSCTSRDGFSPAERPRCWFSPRL